MTTIRWTTKIAFTLHLDDEQQAEWDALDEGERDSWLAEREDWGGVVDAELEEREWGDA